MAGSGLVPQQDWDYERSEMCPVYVTVHLWTRAEQISDSYSMVDFHYGARELSRQGPLQPPVAVLPLVFSPMLPPPSPLTAGLMVVPLLTDWLAPFTGRRDSYLLGTAEGDGSISAPILTSLTSHQRPPTL